MELDICCRYCCCCCCCNTKERKGKEWEKETKLNCLQLLFVIMFSFHPTSYNNKYTHTNRRVRERTNQRTRARVLTTNRYLFLVLVRLVGHIERRRTSISIIQLLASDWQIGLEIWFVREKLGYYLLILLSLSVLHRCRCSFGSWPCNPAQ